MDDDDDWGLSAAELDAMERNAVAQLASRKNSSSTEPTYVDLDSRKKIGMGGNVGPFSKGLGSPSKGFGAWSSNLAASPRKKSLKDLNVKIFEDPPDRIAVESAYHPDLVGVLRTLSGKRWDQQRKVWTYPQGELDAIVAELSSLSQLQISIDVDPCLCVRSAGISVGSQPVKNYSQVDVEIFVTPPQSVSLQENREQVTGGNQSPKGLQRQSSKGSGSRPKPSVRECSVNLFLHSCGKVAAKCDYDSEMVTSLRKIPRSEWYNQERLWLFPFSSLPDAEKIFRNVHNRSTKVEPLVPLVKRALEAAAVLPDLQGRYHDCVPEVLQETLMNFQVEGVKFALQHGGRALIADEMGLGKTLQALAVVSCFKEDWPVLIIVPSSLRLNWATMLVKWLQIRPSDVTIVMTQGSSRNLGFNIVYSSGKQNVCLDGEFNIVSYDVLSKLEDSIYLSDFKVVIADESHYMKNPTAKRTNACVPLLQKAKYALLLTGTPALSRPIELFKQLQALQPSVYQKMDEYGRRYCQGGVFGVWQGASNQKELHALVKSTVMIRRLKKDVLTQLPKKRREQVFISLDDKGSRELRDLFAQLASAKAEHRLAKRSNDPDEILRVNYLERQLLAQIYTKSAEAKLPGVEDYLTTILEDGCKFLVFAHHQSMLDGVQDLLQKKKANFIRIDGKTPASTRQELVQKFQSSPHVKVALLGIQAAGVGLTFTAASTVIFAEMSWTPGDLLQAEDRVHRIGQESAVNIYYLHAHGSIDDLIWEAVQHKLENLCQVLDGEKDGTLKLGSDNCVQVLDADEEGSIKLATVSKSLKEMSNGKTNLDTYLKPCANGLLLDGTVSSSQGQSTLDAFLVPSEGSSVDNYHQIGTEIIRKDALISDFSKKGTSKRKRESCDTQGLSREGHDNTFALVDDELELLDY